MNVADRRVNATGNQVPSASYTCDVGFFPSFRSFNGSLYRKKRNGFYPFSGSRSSIHDGWFWRIFVILGVGPSNDLEAELLIEFNYGAIALSMICHYTGESVVMGIDNLPALQQVAETLALETWQDAGRRNE
jgi:hypothetical protein